MAIRFYQVTFDAVNPRELGRFWAAVLGMSVLYENDDEVVVAKDAHDYPGLSFIKVPQEKENKNRLHIDLDPDDQQEEVDRLVALGARRVSVGQGPDVTWVVLADPEGNEFCVLRKHQSLVD